MSCIISRGQRAFACALAVCLLALTHPAPFRASTSGVVLSEFRVRGPQGGNDEFIELYNAGSTPVAIGGWKINGSNNAGTVSTRVTITAGVTLNPGCFYLVTNSASGGYSGAVVGDQTYGTGVTDDGGIALLTAANAVVDAVGMSAGSAYKEGTPLASLGSTNANRSYERKPGGLDGHGTDSDDNSGDFVLITPSRPQNSALSCITSGSTNPSGAGVATPPTVLPGDSTLLTVAVTPGANPPSNGLAVSVDLSSIGGASAESLFDNGTNGDVTAGDGTFSRTTSIAAGTIPGAKSLAVTITDAQLRTGSTSIALTVNDPTPPPSTVRDVVVSQVYGAGGNAGATFNADYVELFNREATVVSLTGWTVQYASSAGATWSSAPLSGSIAPGGYYLVRLSTGANGSAVPAPDATGTIAMAAASGKIALVAAKEVLAGVCPSSSAIADFVGYGAAALCAEGSPTPNLSATTAALRKRGGCVDSDDNAGDFSVAAPNPRNSASPVRSCSYQTTTIAAIQGSGSVSPFADRDVTTTGIVTAIKTNGFFLQSTAADVDSDPATSEGLFVFTSTAPVVAVGDLAEVKGTATEFFNLTQIEASLPGDVSVVSSGNALPAPVSLTAAMLNPAGTPEQLEFLEGMRVHADALVSVAPTNEFGEIDTVLSGVTRPMREPGIERGLPIPPAAEGGTDCCIPIWDGNPERIMVDTDGLAGSSRLIVTSNVTLTGVTGPLDFTFGDYKITPEIAPSASANMTAVAVPAATNEEFTVGSFNIENFANNDIQRRKAALHIRTIMRAPDVVGTVEIASLSALQALAAQVNADAVAAGDDDPMYQAYLIPAVTGTQHVGFLVKSSRVLVHSVTQRLADQTFTNPSGQVERLHDRPPLVLDATVAPNAANPAHVLIVVNHLRSFIDAELVSAEGARVRAKRTAQAEAIAQLLDELQDATPGGFVISVGDYNAFEFNDGYTDPLSVLRGQPTPGDQMVTTGSPDLVDPDVVNLTTTLTPDQRYTFVFGGTPQALDHVLVNQAAARYVQRYAIARSNADFPDAFATDPSRPERNSDHDSPVAYFAFPGSPVIQLNGGAAIQHEAFTPFVDPGATAHDDNGPLQVSVSGSVDVDVPGVYVLTYSATNTHTTVSVTRTVTVADTVAPAIANFVMTPDIVSVPNHQFFPAIANYLATDASGSVTCELSVASNEPVNGVGDGNTNTDWAVVSPTLVRLRAERSGRGDGRIYTITARCADPSGNASEARGTVTIRQ